MMITLSTEWLYASHVHHHFRHMVNEDMHVWRYILSLKSLIVLANRQQKLQPLLSLQCAITIIVIAACYTLYILTYYKLYHTF